MLKLRVWFDFCGVPDRSNRWSTNLHFHWLETAGTGLFLVYNDTERLNGMGPINRAFIVKYVGQFDILR